MPFSLDIITSTFALGIFGLGPMELAIVLVILLLLFGATKLPKLGSGLGESYSNFKKAMRDEKAKEELDRAEDAGQDVEVKVEVQAPEALEAHSLESDAAPAETEDEPAEAEVAKAESSS